MPVDIFKKKKDGTPAYLKECHALLVRQSQCEGQINRCYRRADSFGQPFTTHADLCEKHAIELGFTKEPSDD